MVGRHVWRSPLKWPLLGLHFTGDKFAWRPAPGVRSTSEVYMYIVDANFYLLNVTGVCSWPVRGVRQVKHAAGCLDQIT